ncbi:hypothetical protein FOH10_29495 [Nocardia otitidiscaviarum]|uniref:Uncharacterized protein n=1 Tax=Nocardia otitidiscaviarum TaxID=1823 RepID=A0A516NTS6_9NOCA|nr:hypothetical protein [Nocardia otitidiscaviarum]MCP9621588.1 hypothetical protein [Nocardia otitidiscaviarum]QDP82254.1 hypothetical protein FOH10_29495 [Nocardia otitidiscaviarum]
MSDRTHPDWITPAPSDLYHRLFDLREQIGELRREMTRIRIDYGRLHRKPEDLAVDDLGDPIDPVHATEQVMHALQRADEHLSCADIRLNDTRGRYATRLKLTDAAAEARWQQIQQRDHRDPIERTR